MAGRGRLRGQGPIRSKLQAILSRPVRFVDSWWLPIGLGGATGALLVFIVLFLEPSGTDRYTASFRTLRLSGYGLCVLLPFLIVHGLTRWWVDRRGAVWRLGHEILALIVLILLMINACYAYNAIVINNLAPTFGDWWAFTIGIAIPYFPLLVPPSLLVRRAIVAVLGDRVGEERLVLVGRNQDDRLRLAPSDFVMAEAEQNYVIVSVLRRAHLEKRMFRATLSEIEAQLPGAVRVHRSFLVNPERVQAVEGNARKRFARIDGSDERVPVSARFDLSRLPP